MSNNFLRVRRGFTLVELLVVIAIIGVLAGLLLPAIQQARETARRMDCATKIGQLSKAAQQFEIAYKTLPWGVRQPTVLPAGTPSRGPRMSGITKILPYIELGNLYALYQQDKDWNDNTTPAGAALPGALIDATPTNRAIAEIRQPLFNCASSTNPERRDGDPEIKAAPYVNAGWTESVAVTDYSAVLGVSYRLAAFSMPTAPIFAGPGILSQTNPGRMGDVRDGLSTTIMYAESAGRPTIYRKNRIPAGGASVAGNHTNGGGWARPGSDFFVDGARITNVATGTADFPGTAAANVGVINVSTGEDIGGLTCSPSTGFPLMNTNGMNTTPAASTSSMSPTAAVVPAIGNYAGSGEVYSFHVGGANVAYGDGRVDFISQAIGIDEFARQVTREAADILRGK